MRHAGAGSGSLRRALLGGAAGATVVWFVLVLVWDEGPFALTFDDAYYYFGIARNVAAGHGSTFDQLNGTNGYHPLWLVICLAPFTLGLDDLVAARVLLLFQVVAGWGVASALVAVLAAETDEEATRPRARGRAVESLRRPAPLVLGIAFGLAVANPFVVKTFVNGLESGIVVPVHAALLLRVARHLRSSDSLTAAPARWRWGTGVLLAVAFLARTDFAVVLAALGLWALADARRDRDGGASTMTLTAALGTLFGPATLTAVVYLGLNQRWFGTPWQISGLVKRAPLTAISITLSVAVLVAALLIGRAGYRREHRSRRPGADRFPRVATFFGPTAWYAASCFVLVGYYSLQQTQQWLWYYAPVVLYLMILFVLAMADVLAVAGATTGGRARPPEAEPAAARRVLAFGGAVFVLPLLVGLGVQGATFADPTVRSIQIANRDAARWIDANLPADAVLLSWDAGVVGYFSHRRTVNFDGVVNSLAFHDAQRQGRTGEFLRCQRVGYVVNHGDGDGGDDADIVRLIDQVWGPGAREPAPLHRVPFVYSGSTNTAGIAGARPFAVRLYRVDPARVGPRSGDVCPA